MPAVPKLYSRQRGFSLIELSFAAVLASIAVLGLTYLTIQHINDTRNTAMGMDAVRVAQATNKFVNANYTAIASSAFPYPITLAQLQAPTDYLNGSFSAINGRGQTYAISVVKNAQGGLEAMMVTTGGLAINDGDLSDIAGVMVDAKVGGGYLASTGGTTAKGYQGAWSRDVSAFGLNPGAGHLAVFLAYNNAAVLDDALHRSAHPENIALNTMSTNIAMAGNGITGASDVKFNAANQGVTFFGGGEKIVGTSDFGISFQTNSGMERMRLYNDGHLGLNSYITTPGGNGLSVGGSWFYGDPTNAAVRPGANGGTLYVQGTQTGGGTAHLNVAGNITAQNTIYAPNWFRSTGNTGWYSDTYGVGIFAQDSSWVRATTNFYSPGQVQAGSIQSNSTINSSGRITAGEFFLPAGGANDGWGCDTNGLIARAADGSGSLENCVNGVWKRLGVNRGQYYNVANYVNQNYNGHNWTDHDMVVQATSNGYNCGTLNNDYSAFAIVSGMSVAANITNNTDAYKQYTMTFMVPSGADYTIGWTKYKCNTQTNVFEYR